MPGISQSDENFGGVIIQMALDQAAASEDKVNLVKDADTFWWYEGTATKFSYGNRVEL